MTEPLSPHDAVEAKHEAIPDVIIEIVNGLIVKNLRHDRATVDLEDVTSEAANAGIDIGLAFDSGWFDVEPLYRAKGWDVTYDQPAYNETGRSYFTFAKNRNAKGR